VIGVGWSGYERHEEQCDYSCHDTRTIHGVPLCVDDHRKGCASVVGRTYFETQTANTSRKDSRLNFEDSKKFRRPFFLCLLPDSNCFGVPCRPAGPRPMGAAPVACSLITRTLDREMRTSPRDQGSNVTSAITFRSAAIAQSVVKQRGRPALNQTSQVTAGEIFECPVCGMRREHHWKSEYQLCAR